MRDTIPERAACWLILLAVHFLVGVPFFYSGKGEIFDDNGHPPPALKQQFQGTFIDKIPGVDAASVIIGVLAPQSSSCSSPDSPSTAPDAAAAHPPRVATEGPADLPRQLARTTPRRPSRFPSGSTPTPRLPPADRPGARCGRRGGPRRD